MKFLAFFLFGVVCSLEIEPMVEQLYKAFQHSKMLETALNKTHPSYKPVLIFQVSMLGLGNRLRIMSSAYHLAQESGRNLIVVWLPSRCCYAQFNEIFSIKDHEALNISVIDVNFPSLQELPDEDSATGILYKGLDRYVTRHSAVPLEFFTEYNRQSFFLDKEWFYDTNKSILVLWTRISSSFFSSTCSDYIRNRQQFYNSLVPALAVQNIVDVFLQHLNIFKSEMQQAYSNEADIDSIGIAEALPLQLDKIKIVGVHARTYDEAFDWPVIPPMITPDHGSSFQVSENHLGEAVTATQQPAASDEPDATGEIAVKSLRFDETTPVELFDSFIGSMLRSKNDTIILVVSNSEGFKHAIMNRYNDRRVIALISEDTNARSTSDGIVLAAAEFIILQQYSDVIVHTRGSSFAQEAAVARDLPVIDLFIDNGFDGSPPPVPLYWYFPRSNSTLCTDRDYMVQFAYASYVRSHSSYDMNINGFDDLRPDKYCYNDDGVQTCGITVPICPCSQSMDDDDDDNDDDDDDDDILQYMQSTRTIHCIATEGSRSGSDSSCIRVVLDSNGHKLRFDPVQ